MLYGEITALARTAGTVVVTAVVEHHGNRRESQNAITATDIFFNDLSTTSLSDCKHPKLQTLSIVLKCFTCQAITVILVKVALTAVKHGRPTETKLAGRTAAASPYIPANPRAG